MDASRSSLSHVVFKLRYMFVTFYGKSEHERTGLCCNNMKLTSCIRKSTALPKLKL